MISSVVLTHAGEDYKPSKEAMTAFRDCGHLSLQGMKCHKSGVYIWGIARGTRCTLSGMFSYKASYFETIEDSPR